MRLERIFGLCANPNIIREEDETSTNGVLLYGWSGTGKALLAKEIARIFASTFYNITMGDIIFRYAGQSERYVKMFMERTLSTWLIYK